MTLFPRPADLDALGAWWYCCGLAGGSPVVTDIGDGYFEVSCPHCGKVQRVEGPEEEETWARAASARLRGFKPAAPLKPSEDS